MKILYVSPYPPAADGIGSYTYSFATAMRCEGHDVRVVLPRHMHDCHEDVIGAMSVSASKFHDLSEAILTWDPDVVHVQFAIAAFGTRTVLITRWLDMLRVASKAPIVVTMHEVTYETALLGAVGRTIYRRIANCCDQVIVHTEAAFNVLTGPVGGPTTKVNVVPHPSVLPPVAGSAPEDLRVRYGLGAARILLAFGFIHVDKGLDDLVDALRILRQSATVPLDDVCVVVAGTVRPRRGLFRVFEARDRLFLRRVLRQADHSTLRSHLVLTGYVQDGDVAGWFHAAEAVVLPYRRTEHSGVAGLANGCGVPILASTAGGLSEQIADARWTFPPGRPDLLAEVLANFLSAPLGHYAAAPSRRQTTDLTSIVAQTLGIYLTLKHSTLDGPSDAS